MSQDRNGIMLKYKQMTNLERTIHNFKIIFRHLTNRLPQHVTKSNKFITMVCSGVNEMYRFIKYCSDAWQPNNQWICTEN